MAMTIEFFSIPHSKGQLTVFLAQVYDAEREYEAAGQISDDTDGEETTESSEADTPIHGA